MVKKVSYNVCFVIHLMLANKNLQIKISDSNFVFFNFNDALINTILTL